MPDPDDHPTGAVLRERIAGHWRLDDERWVSHQREHVLLDRATRDVAEREAKALEAYKVQANEFRASLSDQRAEFITRSEHSVWGQRLDALEDDRIARDAERRTELASRLDQRDRDRRDQERERFRLGVLVSIVSIVASAVVAIVLHVVFP